MSDNTIADTVGKRAKKYFERYKEPFIDMPDLFEGQTESFNWLTKDGIKEIFDIYPVRILSVD